MAFSPRICFAGRPAAWELVERLARRRLEGYPDPPILASCVENARSPRKKQAFFSLQNPSNLGPAPLQKCVGDFCCSNFGEFWRGFSRRIFLGAFSHKKNPATKSEKIRRPKNENPRKIRFAKNRPKKSLEREQNARNIAKLKTRKTKKQGSEGQGTIAANVVTLFS